MLNYAPVKYRIHIVKHYACIQGVYVKLYENLFRLKDIYSILFAPFILFFTIKILKRVCLGNLRFNFVFAMSVI